MQEIWRDAKYIQQNGKVLDFSGLYKVSNLGNVWSNRTKKVLKFSNDGRGYQQVKLYKDGNKYMCLVHRLVAQAFIPNPYNLPEVNHKIETEKANNCVENLEWISSKDNSNYGTRNQRIGTKHSKEVNVYTLDGTLLFKCKSAVEAGEKTNNSSKRVSEICRGIRKSSKGYIFRYIDETIEEKFRNSMTNNAKISKATVQLSLSGETLREWPSINEIERVLGYNRSGIINCCKGKYQTSYGYRWKYKEAS